MATKKSSSKSGLSGLKNAINSPRFGKAFKALIVVLIVGAVGYGGYLLFNERFSSAASNTFYATSKGITHASGGQAVPGLNSKTKVWKTGIFGFNQVAWGGPKKKLAGNKQYMACFYYTTYSKTNGVLRGFDLPGTQASATVDIINGSKTIRSEKITAPARPKGTKGYDRTCLPFHLKKTSSNTEFRVKNVLGTLYIRKTAVRGFTKSQAKAFLGKTNDSTTIITGQNFIE